MSQPYCPVCKNNVPDGQMRLCPSCGHLPMTEHGVFTGWPRDPLLGQMVAEDLQVVRMVGGGGFGRVYEVYRVGSSTREVMALKVLNASLVGDLEQEQHFLRELRLMMQIRHPNVVRCHRGGRLRNGALYMLMEMIHGRVLQDVIREAGPLSAQRAAHIGAQLAEGLSAAHAHGVLHRDLKPDNILVNEQDHTWLIDFGVGKELGEGTAQRRLSRIIGTPLYMAPEQCRPGEAVDDRLDLYQLGAVLHFTLTGQPPYQLGKPGANPAMELAMLLQLQHKRRGGPGPRPSECRPELARQAPALDALVSRLLSLDPQDRPARAIEVAQELRQICDAPAQPPAGARAPALLPTAQAPGLEIRLQEPPAATPHTPKASVELPLPGIRDDTLVDPDPAGARIKTPESLFAASTLPPEAFSPPRAPTAPEQGRARLSARPTVPTQAALAPRQARPTEPLRTAPAAQKEATPRRSQTWLWVVMLLGILALGGGAMGLWWVLPRMQRAQSAAPLVLQVHEQSPLRLDAASLGELVPQAGPSHGVAQVLFAPGGQWLASSDLGGVVRLYEPDGQRALRVWPTLPGAASLLATSSSGRWLVAGGKGPQLHLWDVESGALVHQLEGFGGGVQALALSPQGDKLAVVGAGGSPVTLWDARAGKQIRALGEVSPQSVQVGFTPKGELVVVSARGDVQVVPLEGQGELRSLNLQRPVQAAALSPEGTLLAVGDPERDTISLIDLEGGAPRELSGHAGGVLALSFAQQGGRLASVGGEDRQVRVWDSGAGKELAALQASGPLERVSMAPDGQRVAAARLVDERASLWSLDKPQEPRLLDFNDGRVDALAVDPKGGRLATAGGYHRSGIQLWDSKRGALLATLEGHEDGVRALSWGEGDRLLSASVEQPQAILWDTRQNKRLLTLEQARGRVLSLDLSARSQWAALGDQEGLVHIVATRNGHLHKSLRVHEGEVLALAWHPKQMILASAGKDQVIHLWKMEQAEPWATLRGHVGPVQALSWDPGGQRLLSGGQDGSVRLWTLEGELVKTWEDHEGQVWDVAWSPDGSLFGSVGSDRALRLRDPEGRMTGQIRRQHMAPAQQVAFLPRGGWVATGGGSLLVQALAGEEWWRIWRPSRGWLHVWNDGRFACHSQGCALYQVRNKEGHLAGARDPALKSLRRP